MQTYESTIHVGRSWKSTFVEKANLPNTGEVVQKWHVHVHLPRDVAWPFWEQYNKHRYNNNMEKTIEMFLPFN